ncbi:hypothetical protein HYH03_000206 [Edaphochlamys debaryana]|uniref:Ubiquitin-like domain-containing protein n=1 Tax=Edaphochlamys debaryana TaxID=47281 RepID=A0A835YF61_9CHLO|nr:hypothetical protein HYH03_000206 [Edaphochlamys debaryana]|eukprot:KAG2501705.1 hypothetical protein HYH03_000206 [Edaphochlamys debaryana]
MALWTIHVKFGAQNLEVALAPNSSVEALQTRLQELTGAFVRKQKLIHKGKVLAPNVDLTKAGLADGAKVMLMVSGGDVVQTAGQQALQQAKKAKQDEAAQRVKDLYAQAKGLGGATASAIAAAEAASKAAAAAAAAGPSINWEERRKNWEKTGIVAARDQGLTSLPDDLYASGPASAKVCDLSRNRLPRLPPSLGQLGTALHTLRLEHNALSTEGVPWAALYGLAGLTSLTLDHNALGELPGEGLERLTGLQVLGLSGNRLARLPDSLGALTALEALAADGNRLEALPDSIDGCASLTELTAEGNAIRCLPPAVARLTRLRVLRLDGNMVSALPPELLGGCSSLASLSLQDNPITADQLRSSPGFAEYDARRVALCNKQLESNVSVHATRSFTEGAEDRQWSRWGAGGGPGQGGAGGKG